MGYWVIKRLLNLLASPCVGGEQDLEKDYKIEETQSEEPWACCTCEYEPQ